jgi:hypothetical protein
MQIVKRGKHKKDVISIPNTVNLEFTEKLEHYYHM